MKTKAIQIMETGGPDVMRLVDIDVPPPGKGEIQLRQTAIGLNYIDTYHRSGLYALPLPAGIGMENYVAGIERSLLQNALTQSGGVQTKAADVLGISYRSFRHLMKKYGL